MKGWMLAFLLLTAFVGGSARAQTEMTEVSPPEPANPEESPSDPETKASDGSSGPPFQPGMDWQLTWDMSYGLGDTNTFADNYSFRGASLNGLYNFRPGMSAGMSVGWHVLDERQVGVTATRDSITVTGTQIRTVNFVPLLAQFEYALPLPIADGARLALRLGLGGVYMERRFEVGILIDRSQSEWGFGLSPAVDLVIPTKSTALVAGLAYNLAVESGEIETQQYLNFRVGFRFD